MSLHYNAFISYKHAELDNKIAAMVERGLEHYHIPHKIRKKTGMKKIERIFRDTDELPITSDLSGTIAEALENADYLIVICSTNTCKSMWVEREIKLFLKNHTQDQILTVLADGEPVDVVPEILKNKEITRVNEHGIEETVTIPVEPLSCDFRLPAREAKNVELPRLAATLIGCSYNELMDRQRQYKMKRLTAIFAAVLAVTLTFAGYMIYSNKKVNDSYRASLISQSKYLANESEKLLENGDRINALHLALSAVPSDEIPNRPVVPEAVKAITQASMAYLPNNDGGITSTWNYEMSGSIEEIYSSPEDSMMCAIDRFGNIKIWDSTEHKELYNYSPKNNRDVPSCFTFISEEKAILAGSHFIVCINPITGEQLWEKELKDEYIIDDVINITKDGNIMFTLNSGTFCFCSKEDGKIYDKYELPKELIDSFYMSEDINNVVLSQDNTRIAFTFHDENKKVGIGIYDITSGKTICKNTDGDYVPAVLFPTDNELFMAYIEDTANTNTKYYSSFFCKTDREKIICLNPEDLSVKWEKDFVTNDVAYASDFLYIKKNNSIAYYSGDASDIWNVDSGEELHHFTLNSGIVYAFANEDMTTPNYITRDGHMAGYVEAEKRDHNTLVSRLRFTDELDKATVGKGLFLSRDNGKRIIQYNSGVYDNEWEVYETAPETDSIYYSYMDDNVAAVLSDVDESVVLDLFDPNDKKYIKSIVLSKPESGAKAYQFIFLGTCNGKLLMSNAKMGDGELGLVSVDYKTGEFTREKINNYNYDTNDIPEYENGKIVFAENETLDTYIMVYDVSSKKTDKYRIPTDKYYNVKGLYYFEKQGFIYIASTYSTFSSDEHGDDYIIDINENEIYPVSYDDSWNGTLCVSMNDDGKFIALTDEKNIVIKDIKGNNMAVIPTLDVKMRRPVFVKENGSGRNLLVVPFTDGNLCRYDAMTGKLVGMTEYTTNSTADYESTFTVDTEHSCIYFHYSSITNIFDLDSFIELGYLTSSMGYHAPTDTFPCLSKDKNFDNHLGYFRRYNLDDLIKKAKDILQDHEMPQEQRDAYGIG